VTKTRGALALGAVVTAVLASAPTASAAVDPGTFAAARKGHLLVASSVLVGNREVEMMGGWVNDSMSCARQRRLDVRVLIDRVRRGSTDRFRDEISALVQNCAEGGPNLGFVLRARDVDMACPDGTWKPGQYTFVTNTLHRASGLRAIASLFFRERDRC
jgi:hypothetical protein